MVYVLFVPLKNHQEFSLAETRLFIDQEFLCFAFHSLLMFAWNSFREVQRCCYDYDCLLECDTVKLNPDWNNFYHSIQREKFKV